MKISLIQMNSTADKQENLLQASRLIEQAIQQDQPDMVVLPEMFNCLGGSKAIRHQAAEILPKHPLNLDEGETYQMLKALSIKHNLIIHGGSICEKDEDHYYNTSIIFNRDGTELARYRKIHLCEVSTPDGTKLCESDTYSAGDSLVTFTVEGITFGCSLCYDLRFPTLYQQLRAKGAQVFFASSAFILQTGKDHWEVLCRARAIEQQAYVIATNQYGDYTDKGITKTTWGHSMAVNPWGSVIGQAEDKVGILTVSLDMDYLGQVRQQLLTHRHHKL